MLRSSGSLTLRVCPEGFGDCTVFLIESFTLPETNSSPLKIGRAPKGNDRTPTIHFQVLAVSFREGKDQHIFFQKVHFVELFLGIFPRPRRWFIGKTKQQNHSKILRRKKSQTKSRTKPQLCCNVRSIRNLRKNVFPTWFFGSLGTIPQQNLFLKKTTTKSHPKRKRKLPSKIHNQISLSLSLSIDLRKSFPDRLKRYVFTRALP